MIGACPCRGFSCAQMSGESKCGTLLLCNVINVRAYDTKVWNPHEVARICDHEASSHRKDIERISNVAAEPMAGEIESRSGTNDAYRTVRTVCIAEDECGKMHGSQWHE